MFKVQKEKERKYEYLNAYYINIVYKLIILIEYRFNKITNIIIFRGVNL